MSTILKYPEEDMWIDKGAESIQLVCHSPFMSLFFGTLCLHVCMHRHVHQQACRQVRRHVCMEMCQEMRNGNTSVESCIDLLDHVCADICADSPPLFHPCLFVSRLCIDIRGEMCIDLLQTRFLMNGQRAQGL